MKWKPVPGWEETYRVSSEGEVFSIRSNKLLRPSLTGNGYPFVCLCTSGKKKQFMIHRMVALAFIENGEPNLIVNHIDGNKKNNCVSNLEWVSMRENLAHAVRTGLRDPMNQGMVGDDNHKTVVRDKDVPKVFMMREKGMKFKDIAKAFNVSISCINHILHKRRKTKGDRYVIFGSH